MCHTCSELQREVKRLKAALGVVRNQNIKLAVENNNLRHVVGKPMLPVRVDYLTAWEQAKEAGI